MLPGAVAGSMLGVRAWRHKAPVDPQASREHASANGRGSMAPQERDPAGGMLLADSLIFSVT